MVRLIKLKEFYMDNDKDRVLAYRASKVIEQKELAHVSGGMQWSHYETLNATGSSAAAMDARGDVTLDW